MRGLTILARATEKGEKVGCSNIVPPFHITCPFDFSRYINFVMYLHMIYIYVHKKISKKVKSTSIMKQRE
jgi:hypothetical protein